MSKIISSFFIIFILQFVLGFFLLNNIRPSRVAVAEAHVSSTNVMSKWLAACDFSTTNSKLPDTILLLDNYAARSEARAILDRTPEPWSVSLDINFGGSTVASAAAPALCAGRFAWRGFVPPFWVTSQVLHSFGKSADDAATLTLPALSAMDSSDLKYFASCDNTADLVATKPMRIRITNVALDASAASWNFTDPTLVTTTQSADSACNLNFASTTENTMAQFVRFFVSPDGASNAAKIQEIPYTALSNGDRYYEWVSDSASCPLSVGIVMDTAICPSTVQFSGSAKLTFKLVVDVATDPVIVWFMWVPSVACIVVGLVCLIIYVATYDKASKPETAKPSVAAISPLLSVSKIALVSAVVVSAIALALTMIIDQNQPLLVGTPYSTILMGSLFFISAVLVVALGGVVAGKEDKRLKSMPPFIVAWLRLVSRALALGACCAAWYRGFYIIGIIYVACQVFVEIGFWANLVSTFASSHEPIRYGIAGDQMLTVGGLSLCGLYLVPSVGIIASASSRIFCLIEMSERFQVSKQFDDEDEEEEEMEGLIDEQTNNNNNTDQEQTPKPQNQDKKKNSKKPQPKQRNEPKPKKNDTPSGPSIDAEAGTDITAFHEQEMLDEAEIKEAFNTFPVEWEARLAAGFDGLLSSRWWVLVFEVLFIVGLALILAHVHPPFTIYTIVQLLVAFGHFGAGFAVVTSQCGEGFGSGVENSGAGSVLAGPPRETIHAISNIPFNQLEPKIEKESSDDEESSTSSDDGDRDDQKQQLKPVNDSNNGKFSSRFYDDEEDENKGERRHVARPVRKPPQRRFPVLVESHPAAAASHQYPTREHVEPINTRNNNISSNDGEQENPYLYRSKTKPLDENAFVSSSTGANTRKLSPYRSYATIYYTDEPQQQQQQQNPEGENKPSRKNSRRSAGGSNHLVNTPKTQQQQSQQKNRNPNDPHDFLTIQERIKALQNMKSIYDDEGEEVN